MTGNPPLSSGWLQLKTTLSHVDSPVKSLGLLGAAVEYEQSKRFKTCIFFFRQDTILDLTKSALWKLGYGGTKLVKKCI